MQKENKTAKMEINYNTESSAYINNKTKDLKIDWFGKAKFLSRELVFISNKFYDESGDEWLCRLCWSGDTDVGLSNDRGSGANDTSGGGGSCNDGCSSDNGRDGNVNGDCGEEGNCQSDVEGNISEVSIVDSSSALD